MKSIVGTTAILIIIVGIASCDHMVPGLSDYNKGVKYQQTGQRDLARQQFRIAIQKNPELAEAYLGLGRIYIDDGWLDGAEEMT